MTESPFGTPSFWENDLNRLRGKNLYRKIRMLKSLRGIRAQLDGRDVLLFSGNDYLGLSQDPRVKDAFCEASRCYGVGSGAARLISGGTDLHTLLEEKIAEFKRTEKAVLFSAGYLANLGVLTAFAGKDDILIMDKLCHASLIDGARLSSAKVRVFPHLNYRKCEEILGRSLSYRRRILVTESVFSMDGDLADLETLAELKERYKAMLVVDDAHGTGVLGAGGRGGYEDFDGFQKIDCITGTLSKALGCFGGFAAGSRAMADYLVNFARPFIFATSLPPAICGAACVALNILTQDPGPRKKLWENVRKIERGLAQAGLEIKTPVSPIIPVMIGEEKKALEASDILLESGILIPAVRFPTVPQGKARLRLTANAVAGDPEIESLVKAFSLIKTRALSDKL